MLHLTCSLCDNHVNVTLSSFCHNTNSRSEPGHNIYNNIIWTITKQNISELKIFDEMRWEWGDERTTHSYQDYCPRHRRQMIWSPPIILTMIFMLAAGGWGPGLPLVSSPLAILALYLLWTSRMVWISAGVTPRERGSPLQAGPVPWHRGRFIKVETLVLGNSGANSKYSIGPLQGSIS